MSELNETLLWLFCGEAAGAILGVLFVRWWCNREKKSPVVRYLEYVAKCQRSREQYPVPLPDMFTSRQALADEAAGLPRVPARSIGKRR